MLIAGTVVTSQLGGQNCGGSGQQPTLQTTQGHSGGAVEPQTTLLLQFTRRQHEPRWLVSEEQDVLHSGFALSFGLQAPSLLCAGRANQVPSLDLCFRYNWSASTWGYMCHISRRTCAIYTHQPDGGVTKWGRTESEGSLPQAASNLDSQEGLKQERLEGIWAYLLLSCTFSLFPFSHCKASGKYKWKTVPFGSNK